MKAIGWSKVVVFPVCLIPVAYLGLVAYEGNLGANPLEVITHTTGDWTISLPADYAVYHAAAAA